MEASSRSLGPVVIGQDEQTELHVQAIVQSGRRQLDIRIWRRGPAGFAPSRSALTVEADDLAVLIQGIEQLLAESNGAQQVARVICDKDDSRRLRAQTEPFGTHFTARLGFWQRVRDSWRPVGDGLQLDAEQLAPLQKTLRTLSPHLISLTDHDADAAELALQHDAIYRWPSPGADWLTVDGDQLAFHPRGLRVTASVAEEDEDHRLAFQQWRREDTLWVPCDTALDLNIKDLEVLLSCVRTGLELRGEAPQETRELCTLDDERVRVELLPSLDMEIGEKEGEENSYGNRLAIPAEFIPHFGRLLVEAGNLLLTRLSTAEREELLNRGDVAVSEEIVSEALLIPEDKADPENESTDETSKRPVFATAGELVARVLRSEEELQRPPVVEPQPADEQEDEVRRLAPLGEVRLGRHSVYLYDLREDQQRFMSMQWDGRSLNVPLGSVEKLVEDLRQMYYQALRGRRGQAASIGPDPAIHMSVHHQGSSTQVLLEHEIEGEKTSILFPVAEVPAFLNAAETALTRSAREPQPEG